MTPDVLFGPAGPARHEAGGILVDIRVTPRGGRDALTGAATLSDGRRVLLARVRAVPENDAANRALVALAAEAFGVPKASISIAGGRTSRLKTLRIVGSADDFAARLAVLAVSDARAVSGGGLIGSV